MYKFVRVFSNTWHDEKYIIVCNQGNTSRQKNDEPDLICPTNTLWRTNPSDLGLETKEILCTELKWR